MGTASRRSRGLILIVALLALVLCTASPAAARPLKKGSKGPRVAFVQKVLGLHADRIYGDADQARGQALPAPPRADRRRHRRPATWTRAHARPRPRAAAGAHVGRGRRAAAAARARASPPTACSGPAPTRAVKALPAQPRPHRRRRRRPRDLGGARHSGSPPSSSAARCGGAAPSGLPRVRPARDRGRQPDRPHALQVRRRARELQRLRLRLLGLGLVRAARRRAARSADGLQPADVLRRPGQGPLHHDLLAAVHAFMVVHGRRFDTSGAGGGASRWQWDQRSAAGYTVRHPPGL